MTERARNIVIAVALAGLAALLTGLYVTSYQRHVQRGEEHITVFVAARDIPSGKVTNGFSNTYSAVLAVTDAQAQKLDFTVTQASSGSAGNGQGTGWSLALRSPVKADDSPESVTTLGSVLLDGLRRGQATQLYGAKVGGGQ